MEELSFHSSSFPYGQVSQPFVFPRVNYCFPSLLPFLLLPSFLRTFKNFHPLQQLLSVVSTNTTLHNVQMLCKLYFGAKNLLLNLKIVKENYTPFFPSLLDIYPWNLLFCNLDLLLYFVSDIQQLFWDFLFIMILGYIFTSFLGFQLHLLRVY